jgi:hypothetical protein
VADERVAEQTPEPPRELLRHPSSKVDPQKGLEELLLRASTVRFSERKRLASSVNHLLAALAKRNPSKGSADFLHQLLESDALLGLRDSQGLSSRAAAVSALICMGYPHALEVSPEELRCLRRELRWRRLESCLKTPAFIALLVGSALVFLVVLYMHFVDLLF